MTCCIEKSSIFAAAFGKCIYKVSNILFQKYQWEGTIK